MNDYPTCRHRIEGECRSPCRVPPAPLTLADCLNCAKAGFADFECGEDWKKNIVRRGSRSKPRTVSCIHAGNPTGDKEECLTCDGKVMLKVFACDLYDTTTEKKCGECPDYQPKPETP